MTRSRFGEIQIIAIVKEADAGMKVEDVCRKTPLAMRLTITGNQNMVAWLSQC